MAEYVREEEERHPEYLATLYLKQSQRLAFLRRSAEGHVYCVAERSGTFPAKLSAAKKMVKDGDAELVAGSLETR